MGVGVLLYSLTSQTPLEIRSPLPWYAVPLHLLGGLIFLGPVGEEFGWRGYALPRLLTILSPVPASLVLGLAWAPWHLPLVLVEGSFQSNVPFLLFLVSTVGLSVLYTWLYSANAGRLFAVLLFHAASNTAATVLLSQRTIADHAGPLIATTGVTIVAATVSGVAVGRRWTRRGSAATL